ncbi:putative NAC domain-containing protein [Melia azedarach]|uniref:NAC domain-containing protein n=1 Tax=Melia azedarach TaxID=155640 RepID=A0ACC1YJN3_MELAZ|nr:putative NAC domain-containing protein [Melia azedarach]
MMMMPTGFRFNPTDEELIELLDRKVSGQDMHFYGHFILQTDVYSLDPDHFQWNQNLALSNNERFYYYMKENDSREVLDYGWWRATSHVKKIYVNYNNQILVGFKKPLTFHRFRDYQDVETRRKNAIKTNWIMHEYRLESYSTEWRLCRIKYKGKPRVQEEVVEINIGNASIPTLAEQQQPPQSFQTISKANFSHFPGGESQNNQQDSHEVNNISENEPSKSSDLILHMEADFSYPCYGHFEDDQLQQYADSPEQLLPSIWSWQ